MTATAEAASFRSRLVSAFDSCVSSDDPRRLRRHLALAVTTGLLRHPFVSARAVAAAAALSNLRLAHLAFRAASPRPSAFAFAILIRAHSSGPDPSLSLYLLAQMLRSGIYLDRFALPFAIRASSAQSQTTPAVTRCLHAVALRRGLDGDAHIATSLLHAYASFGLRESSKEVFDEMPHRTTVTYNALISTFARSSCLADEGISVFADMISDGINPNADTFVAALSCCSSMGALSYGSSVHALATRWLRQPTAEVGTSLVHMYVKCGNLEVGMRVFGQMETRDTSMWTAMIGGLAMHGRGKEAIVLFERMVTEGLSPDSTAFTNVIHACSHSGMVETGIKLFHDMKTLHRIEPRMEHYGVMVDLLGRAGRLEEAVNLVKSMPFVPSQIVWGSLLNACMINNDLGSGKQLERQLLGMGSKVGEEEEGGLIVGMSNVYASMGRWDQVGRLRDKMVERGMKKVKGLSLIEVNGRLERFLVGDTRHPLTFELQILLQDMDRLMIARMF